MYFVSFQGTANLGMRVFRQMSLLRGKIQVTHIAIAGLLMATLMAVATCDITTREGKLSGVKHFSGKEFAGSGTCKDCHQQIAESHLHTPHFLTSASASQSVKGSFDSGENVLILTERIKIVMQRTRSGIFQAGFIDGKEVERKPFDMTIGSGRKGQSYLYWQDHSLFQLPVSWYAPRDTWSNSPGFPTDQLVFNRSIPARCLECHSTYFKTEKAISSRETFNPNQAMLGVDCERCHGPAGEHVLFHAANPGERKPHQILNPAKLTRQQRLDNCALCHSGLRENIMPSFSYMVGDDLNEFSYPGTPHDSAATLDVHGNQYGLLSESKCFRMSDLDCSTCHDVHKRETNQLELFSSRCMSCHSRGGNHYCKQPELAGLDLVKNCIDCHMPELPSRKVFLRTADNLDQTPFFVRTHLIGVYEQNIKQYLEKIGQ